MLLFEDAFAEVVVEESPCVVVELGVWGFFDAGFELVFVEDILPAELGA